MLRIREINLRTVGFVRTVHDLTNREKKRLLGEVLQVRGLMPLLMKPRNKQRWTSQDKEELAIHLRRLSNLSPYLVVLVMPGGFFVLPALAWWIDRRRNRIGGPAAPSPG
jgi:hypothetical protein